MSSAACIRTARAEDVPALLAIYNHAVVHSVATFDLEPLTLAEWQQWYARHNVGNHPLLVAEADGTAVGYASLSSYRPMPAYRSAVELSLYIHPAYQGRGLGSALMQRILDMARQDARTHLVVSVITAENAVSRRLHERFGFRFCGCLHEAGYKHGAYHDVVHYELLADAAAADAAGS